MIAPVIATALLLASPTVDASGLSQKAPVVASIALGSGADAAVPGSPPTLSQPEADQDTGSNDIVVTAREHNPPGDPLQTLNAKSFQATQAVDNAVVGPVALAYEHAMPEPVRNGLRNFLGNLHEPVVVLSFLLQLKPGKAAETVGRFAINSTIGGAGLIDVAKRHPFNLPRRANGFADTLGYYGMKPGPFLFLPLIGPTTVRDLIGNGIDRLVLPLSVGGPFKRIAFTIPVGVLSALDRRANFDEQLHKIRDDSTDPYVAARRFYLERRQKEIDGLRPRRTATDYGASSVVQPEISESSVAEPCVSASLPDHHLLSSDRHLYRRK